VVNGSRVGVGSNYYDYTTSFSWYPVLINSLSAWPLSQYK